MGMLQSIFCSVVFCLERVLTWVCFAFVLILLMGMMLILMVYGISVGYHYGQKELAAFAMTSRTTTPTPAQRMGRRSGDESQPVVRLVAVNRSSVENAPRPMLEVYQNRPPPEKIILEKPATPIVLLETESPPPRPDLLPHERDIARKIIGRFRRSKNDTSPLTDQFLMSMKRSQHDTTITHEIQTSDLRLLKNKIASDKYLGSRLDDASKSSVDDLRTSLSDYQTTTEPFLRPIRKIRPSTKTVDHDSRSEVSRSL